MPKTIQDLERDLTGRHWAMQITGRKTLNAAHATLILLGDVKTTPSHGNIYDLAQRIIRRCSAEATEMEHPISLRLTIFEPGVEYVPET